MKRTSSIVVFMVVCLVVVFSQHANGTRNGKAHLNPDYYPYHSVASPIHSIAKQSHDAMTQSETDQWTNLGPDGGYVFSLASDPTDHNRIYAGTADGVYKSTNGGNSWQMSNSGLPSGNVSALVIDPGNTNIIYAGSDSGGVFKST